MRPRIHKLLPAVVISCAVIVFTTVLELSGALTKLEYISYDWRMQHSSADRPAPDDVAVILIDDSSLNALDPLVGRWPWPRSVHADVIDFLALGSPRAIVMDILFSENERGNQPNQLSANDQRLVQSTADAGNVIHAMQIHQDVADEINTSLLNRPLPQNTLLFSVDKQEHASDNNNFYTPLPAIMEHSYGLGVVSAKPDQDGIYRRLPLMNNYQGYLFPALGVAAFTAETQNALSPTLIHKPFLVNYYSNINSYSIGGIIASAQKLMEGETEALLVDPFEFENKIVFIGASAVGLEDLKATPLSSTTPGVMIHAATAANIIHNDILVPAPLALTIATIIIATLLICPAVIYLQHLRNKMLVTLLLTATYIAVTSIAFNNNYVMTMVTPTFAAVMAAALSFLYLLFTEGRDKRRVRTMLAQYVSPAVLNTVVDHYQDHLQAEVGSEEQLSILFSDIRGFTNLSEAIPANQVVEMLNHYFSAMTETIFDHRGTIDKFIGDAIMAFWGAPIKEAQHADLAVRTAIEMHQKLADVNQWLEERNYPNVQIGVGINSGNVILGNIGSVQKLDYTVIGDNVNLASRLEGLTKQYGATVVISENTYKLLQHPIPCYMLDLVRVKGKKLPIRIYAPVLDLDEQIAQQEAQISQAAFDAYLQQDWATSINLYQQLSQETLKSVFIERCQTYQTSPPSGDWDGVFTMTTK